VFSDAGIARQGLHWLVGTETVLDERITVLTSAAGLPDPHAQRALHACRQKGVRVWQADRRYHWVAAHRVVSGAGDPRRCDDGRDSRRNLHRHGAALACAVGMRGCSIVCPRTPGRRPARSARPAAMTGPGG
jgi:hypothetical protein